MSVRADLKVPASISDLTVTVRALSRSRSTHSRSVWCYVWRRTQVNGETIVPDRLLIATGVTSVVPPIPGLDKVPYLTNDTAFDLEQLPESLIVMGGGYVALECAQMVSFFLCADFRCALEWIGLRGTFFSLVCSARNQSQRAAAFRACSVARSL